MDGSDHVDDIAVAVCEMLIVQHYQIRSVKDRNLCHSWLGKSDVWKNNRLKIPDPLLQALTLISESRITYDLECLRIMFLESLGDDLEIRIKIQEPVTLPDTFGGICSIMNHCLTDNACLPGFLIDQVHGIRDLFIHNTGFSERSGQV